jgi:hypothetical protein
MTDFRRENISSQKAYDLLRDWIKLVARHTNPDQDISELLGWLWKLKPQTPDPETGLLPCGERATMWCTTGEGFWVSCGDIAQTKRYETEDEAKVAWNHAMGLPDA